MLIARIKVSGVHAEVITCTDIPAGLVGGQIQIEYDDSVWSDLRKTVVFKGYTTVDIITDAATIVIPPEVVSRQHVRLSVGILGTSPDGAVVVPTLWADLGIVKPATDPSGDNAADPQLPIWAQLLHMIGDLNGLGTTAKDSLVAAVNELLKTSGGSGGITPDAVKQLITGHIADHSEIDDQCHPDIRQQLNDLDQRFGDLEQLETEDKSSLVAAVNEVLGKAGTGGSGGNANCLLTIETITIEEPGEPGNIPVTGIVLDYSSISLNAGESMMLAASVTPSNATNTAVIWETSDNGIATVENGLVIAVASGNCTITAKSAENSSIKAICSVEVTAESGGTVYFYTLDVAKKHVKLSDGSLVDDNGAFNVTMPYSEGMTIVTCQHSGWAGGYPPFVIKSNGSYSKPEYSEVGDGIGLGRNYTATLNGYAGDAVVYANIYIKNATMDTIKTELKSHKDLFYYIPGGVENAE